MSDNWLHLEEIDEPGYVSVAETSESSNTEDEIQLSFDGRKRKMEERLTEAEAVGGTKAEGEHSEFPPGKQRKVIPTSHDNSDVEIIDISKIESGNSWAQDSPLNLLQNAAQNDSISKTEDTLKRETDYLVSAFPDFRREDVQTVLRQHWNDTNRVYVVTQRLLERNFLGPKSPPLQRPGWPGEGQTEGFQKHAISASIAASGTSGSKPSSSGIHSGHEASGGRCVAARMTSAAGTSSASEAAFPGSSLTSHDMQQREESIEDKYKAVGLVINIVKHAQPDAELKIEEICHLLDEKCGEPHRVALVAAKVLFRLQHKVMPRKVEKLQDDKESPAEVKEELQVEPAPLARGDPILNDPVYKDVQTISKMFPDRDQNELYAYLEVYHEKPDRVQRVIEELLATTNDFEGAGAGPQMKQKDLTKKPTMQEELDILKDMFPDCDPKFLEKSLQRKRHDPERAQNIAAEMTERRNYPRLSDRLARERKEAERRRLWNLEMTVEAFLEKFPDPSGVFHNTEKPMGALYKEHCNVKLLNEFSHVRSGFIRRVLESCNYHLTPAWEELLRHDTEEELRLSKKFRLGFPPRDDRPYPQEPDEFFFHEVWYFQHKQEIQDYLEAKKNIRIFKVVKARAKKELCECKCCYDDELLYDEMETCDDGHLFCQECIRRYAQTQMSEANFTFPCLEEGCEATFPLQVLKKVLPPNSLSILLVRLQEKAVLEADIKDLVTCPFCPFATIMPNPDDKVFKCQNAECLKESCRLCREPNHIPLRCNELEKSDEVAMRIFIENRISEAMLRTCPQCKRRFLKESGCNKMTCPCGTTICYLCREPNIDYDHFGPKKCKLESFDSDQLHEEEMKMAAREAREQYLREHPEAVDIALKYDPDNHIREFREMTKQKRERFGMHFHFEDFPPHDEEDESSYDSSDSDDSDCGHGFPHRNRRFLGQYVILPHALPPPFLPPIPPPPPPPSPPPPYPLFVPLPFGNPLQQCSIPVFQPPPACFPPVAFPYVHPFHNTPFGPPAPYGCLGPEPHYGNHLPYGQPMGPLPPSPFLLHPWLPPSNLEASNGCDGNVNAAAGRDMFAASMANRASPYNTIQNPAPGRNMLAASKANRASPYNTIQNPMLRHEVLGPKPKTAAPFFLPPRLPGGFSSGHDGDVDAAAWRNEMAPSTASSSFPGLHSTSPYYTHQGAMLRHEAPGPMSRTAAPYPYPPRPDDGHLRRSSYGLPSGGSPSSSEPYGRSDSRSPSLHSGDNVFAPSPSTQEEDDDDDFTSYSESETDSHPEDNESSKA